MSVKAKIVAAVSMALISFAVVSCMKRAYGDHCRVRNNAVVIQSTGAVIVPFAVPVATPVAVATPYVYQHSAAHSYAQSLSAEDAQLLEEFKEFKRQRQAQVKAAVVPQTLFAQNCAGCHTPGHASAKQDAIDHLDASKELTSEQRLASIKAIMLGEMPRGKTLDPQVRADLIAELSGVKK